MVQCRKRRLDWMDCIFCKIVAGEAPCLKVYEDEHTLVFMDIAKDADGHMVAIPKKHVESLFDCDVRTLCHLTDTVKRVAEHLKEKCRYEGVDLLHASGECAGQSVPHLHIHILPRKSGDGMDAWPHFSGAKEDLCKVYERVKMGVFLQEKPALETQRLLLRAFLSADAADVLSYRKQLTIHCFADMKLSSLQDAEREIAEHAGEENYYAIVCKESGRVIGEIFAHPEEGQGDTFSLCWMLGEEYRGKGFAFEAAQALLKQLFCRQGARRVFAYTEDYNFPSQKLCERLGMRREGEFKEFISFVTQPDGKPLYENTLQYAILKKEWEQQKNL